MVADREQSQGLSAVFGSQRVEAGRFHFDGHDAVLGQFIIVDFVIVEAVDRDDVADPRRDALFDRLFVGLAQEGEISQWRVVDGAAEDVADDRRVRRGSLGDDDVAEPDIFAHGPAGADADELLHAVIAHEFRRINGNGRDAHARALDGQADAFIGPRIAEDVADIRVADGIVQKSFSNVSGPQGIAGKQDAVGDSPSRAAI